MNNILLDIANKILVNDDFQNIFHRLYKFWFIYDFKNDISEPTLRRSLVVELYKIEIDTQEIKKIIQSSFIFAGIEESESISYIDSDKFHNLAYIIGFSLLSFVEFYQINSLKKVIYRLFTRLGLMVGRDKFINTEVRDIDIFSKIEITNKELKNKLSYDSEDPINKENIYLTDFQLDVIKKLFNDANKIVWISWPTSSGKNFAVKHYLIQKLISEDSIDICIVVPSKALINEQHIMLKSELKKNNLDANLFTYGDINNYKELQNINSKNIFIFTQERLHYFFESIKKDSELYAKFKLDILIIDESYKISQGNRWVLLNYIVKTFLSQKRVAKLILLAPQVKQLKIFWKILWIWEELIHEKYSDFSPVFQNKIYIEEKARSKKKYFYYLSPLNQEKKIIFEYELNFSPSESYKNKLSQYAFLLSTKKPLIVFRDGPDAVQKQAEDIASITPENITDAVLNESLIEYIKETIGDSYDLINPLKKGIAFHHWKVPISIRSRIEDGFNDWSIRILCATTTLSEWVNLPVKYLLIWDDIKDRTRLDFKNLCWRVGRYSSHLTWSIFFINPDKYSNLLDNHDSRWVINEEIPTSPLSQILENDDNIQDSISKKDKFIEYITSSNHKDIQYIGNQEFEYLTGFLFDILYSSPEEFNTFVKINTNLWDTYITKLREKLTIIKSDIDQIWSLWLKEICRKNIFIDPRKQLDLYELIRSWDHQLSSFNPIPWTPWFPKSFEKFNLNIAKSFLSTRRTKEGKEFYPEQCYILDWITEKSIPVMRRHLEQWESIKFIKLFNILEQEIWFKYLNAINVYIDIANLCVSELPEFEELRDSLENKEEYFNKKIISYVEYGAYTPLVFFLLNKGIHRESALILKRILLESKIPLFGEPTDFTEKIMAKKDNIKSRITNKIILEEFNKIF